MSNVVAVIKTAAIIGDVNTGNAVFVVVSGGVGVYKGVLGPVAGHHHKPDKNKRKNEDKQSCLPAEISENTNSGEESYFPCQCFFYKFWFLSELEVPHQFVYTCKKKTEKIPQKIEEAIPLVGHGRTIVMFHIILCMVHPDVMTEIGVRRLAHKRTQTPGDQIISRFILDFKEGIVAGIMEHEYERPHQV